MFEPSGSMGVSFTWCNCPPRLKTWLTFVFQEGQILGGSSRENKKSSLPNMKPFPCGSSKTWLLLEDFSATFPVTLQAPVPVPHIASSGVGSRCAWCPERDSPARAATEGAWPSPWASSTAFLVLHGPPDSTELRWWASQYPASWINWGILSQYWCAFLGL